MPHEVPPPGSTPYDALRRSEELFRSVVEQLPALTYITDAEGTTTYVVTEQVNRLFKLTKQERSQNVDLRWEQRLHPDDRERVLAEWNEAVATGTSHQTEYRMTRGDGKMIWVRDTESVVRDEQGDLVRRQGLMFDITDLVEARERAADAEERFRSLTEQMPAVLYRDAADASEAIYVSPAVERMLGYTPREWLEGSMEWYWALIHPDDRERVVSGVRHSAATQTAHVATYRIRHRDGRYIHVRDSVVYVSGHDDGPVVCQGMISDITEEVEREAWLDRVDQRFRTLVDQVPAVIYLDDMDLKPMYVSPRVEEVFGCSMEAWLTTTDGLRSIIGEEFYEHVDTAYRALADHGAPYLLEYRVTRPDGTRRWVRDQAQRIHNSDGEPFALQGVIVDITDRKLAEHRVARYAEQQRLVAELGIRALEDDGWRGLADQAVRGITSVLGVSHAWALELGEDGDLVTLRAAAGWPAEEIDSRTLRVSERPPIQRILGSEDLVQVSELSAEQTAWPDLFRADGLHSSAAVRIGSAPVFGVLGAHSPQPIDLDRQDISFLRSVANVLAAAILRERSHLAFAESELRRRETLSQLVRSGEEERQRIATELHDDTIQVMTAALITLDREARAVADGDQLRAMAAVLEMRETLHMAVDRTRRLTFELRPPVLEARGLAAALSDLLAEVGRSAGFQVELDSTAPRLAPDIESLAYRTVQELVTNARKHSQAVNLSVKLRDQPGALSVEVTDDGVGFDRARAFGNGELRLNFGLESSAERITLAGGEFDIASSPGTGTTVRFSIPLTA
jgi:PAS domain S-box-containing protein